MSSQQRTFDSKFGVEWFKAGWIIFKTQPATFVFMYIFIVVISLLPLMAQVLGIVSALVGPFVTAGFYMAVMKRQLGKRIMLSDVIEPFSAKGRRRNLFRVGIYQMAGGLIMSLIVSALFSDAAHVLTNAQPNTPPDVLIEQLSAAISLSAVVLFVVLQSLFLMAFSFAVPLVFFNNEQNIFRALKLSLSAFYYNMAPLTIFGLLVALLLIASIPLSLVPALVIMPIAYIGFFVSYQAIFMPFKTTPDKADSLSDSVLPDQNANSSPSSKTQQQGESDNSGRFDA